MNKNLIDTQKTIKLGLNEVNMTNLKAIFLYCVKNIQLCFFNS